MLATLDADLSIPDSRIGSASDAYSYVYECIQADLERSRYRTYVQGLIDGNAPYPNSKRDRTNLNFRQATAIITQFKTPYYDLLCEVPLLFEIETVFGNSEERSDWSNIISEEFHRMLTSWEDWDETMQQCINQMLIHNIGHLYSGSQMDWRPMPARMNEILVKDQSPCKLSALEAVVIRKGFPTTELMNLIANEKYAKAVGWNIRASKEAVKAAYRPTSMPPDRSNTWEWYQQKRHNGDLYFGSYECERVWTAQCAVHEYSGKISNHLLRTDQQKNTFLYSNKEAFDSMDQLICPFFYDTGDGTWHSGRGLGTEIFPYCQIFNKLRCREVDAAMIAASVMVQAKDGDTAKRAQMLTLDNLKIIPEGVNFIEHAIGQNIQATIDVRRDMEGALNQNIGGLMKPPGAPDPRKGQRHALMEMQQAAQLGKGKINQFYSYMDRLGRVMFSKAASPSLRPRHPGVKEALDFQARCFKRGVPKEALVEIDFVRAYRSAGAGSAVNALMSLEALKELAPSFNEPGRLAYMRLYISRLLGTRTADILVGELKTADKKTDQDWQAEVENTMLRQGADGSKFMAEDQNHVIHARSHINDAADHLKEVEAIAGQQDLAIEDLQPLYTHLESYGPHAYEHLQRFKNDPMRAGDFKQLWKQWTEIARMADQVKNNLDEMQEERQREMEEQAQRGPTIDEDVLKHISYKDSPETVKEQMEAYAGIPRKAGDLSVAEQNLDLKQAATQLKAAKQQQQGVIDDVTTAQSVEAHRKEMSEPSNNGNGSK